MFYTIYKITNKINNKIYIGKHQTKDLNDGYMGSGKLIKSAIEKYGLENFKKEILFTFDNESDMNAKEAELVTKEFVKEDTNYNLCPGGHGAWGYLNNEYWTNEKRLQHNIKISPFGKEHSKKYRTAIVSGAKKGRELRSKLIKEGKLDPKTFLGKTHTEETKKKMSLSKKGKSTGSKNSQYGTMWITNEKENKKVKKDSPIPNGWYKGRTISSK